MELRPPAVHALPILALALSLACSPAAAQDAREEGEALRVRELMQLVRDRRVEPDEKRAAMDALLGLGVEGPRQLATQLAGDAHRLREQNAREQARLLRAFERAAARIAKARGDARTLREVGELRKAALAAARDPALTKERIQAVSDPALARLAELLEVRAELVLQREAELAARIERLKDDLADEELLRGYHARCIERLEELPEAARVAARLGRLPDAPFGEDELDGELAFRALLALPMSEEDRRALTLNRALSGELDPEELRGNQELGRIRALLGLRVPRTDIRLTLASREHSKDMAEHGFFSHESPLPGKRTFGDRAARAGTSASSENIAAGVDTGSDAIRGWWYSPGHHRNMLGDHGRTGLGRSGTHWTQLFGG